MIHFVLLISRQGKVRLTKWYSPYTQKERSKVIRELSGVILSRAPKLCNFVEWRGHKVVYKRYASLYFCMCIDDADNELEVLEMIHHFVEILDRYFGSVCELDLIFNFHKAYYILDELLIAGELQESSKKTVARLIAAQDSLVETAKEEASSLSNIIAQATKMKKVEVVFIPSPGVGHLVSTLEFAKLLVNRDNRLSITVLVIKFPNTDEKVQTISSSFDSENLHVINLPERPHVSSTSDGAYSASALAESQKPNVKEAVSNINGQLAAFVVDMFCTTMIDVANEFGVPSLLYFTSGIAYLGLVLHLHTLLENNLEATRLLLQQDELDIPSFSKPVPTNTLPTVVLRKKWESAFIHHGRGLKKASGIIVNSFHELEPHAAHSFLEDSGLRGLPIYPVGPILNLDTKPKPNGLVDSNDTIKWLDDQPHSSVIFICFGSTGAFDEDQVREIACAIEKSRARFLWSIRKPPPKGTMGPVSDYPFSNLVAVLPEGFLDRTVEIGRVIGWAPQVQVLAHPATGGFVSHCGWNSTLESIYYGVPIATWPLLAEQQTNAFELVRELKMGVEIALDYRMEYDVGSNYLLTADKIERGIRSVMKKNGEIRKKVKEMSEQSRKTLLEGGSSYTCVSHLIDYIINQV
ncbi:unnamed protein product [Vicia faba]|uniref:Adaptor AP-1 19 kDa protein n=2 Tax=Fabeae TaxID=163743 RepID=A0AAV0YN60_VICFA|nr:unnamed protein product [Vicia faba]